MSFGRKSDCERCVVASINSGSGMTSLVLCADGPICSSELEISSYADDWAI